MRNILFIMNPKAKGGKGTDLTSILNVFSAEGCRTEVYISQSAGDITERVPEIAEGHDVVVSCGGDGTMNEVVTGLMRIPEEKRPALALIPAGTTNDLAHSHNIPDDFREAAKIAATGSVGHIDIGSLNQSRYFEYVAGFGMFTDISYSVGSAAKSAMGYPAYLLAGSAGLLNMTSIRVRLTTDEGVFEDDIMVCLITNATQVAGFKDVTGYDVDMNDGEFEIMIIYRPKNIYEFTEAVDALLNLKKYRLIKRIKTAHAHFEFETPTAWTLDGEYGGTYTSVDVDNLHSAVRIVEGVPGVKGKPVASSIINNMLAGLAGNLSLLDRTGGTEGP